MFDAAPVHVNEMPGRTLQVEGEEYLFFSGASYLGIPRNRAFQAYVVEGMNRYGTNYASSRNSNLQLEVFEEAENYLAAYTGAEAVLTMSSGYLAGQTLVQALQGSGHFIYAPGAHPAIWHSKANTTSANLKYEDWVKQAEQEVQAATSEEVIIVCNSIDPLKAQQYSFGWVAGLPQNKKITLVVDDSHGFGVTGKDGAGIFQELKKQLPGVRVLVVGSLGKAFGVPAGVILGDKQLIDKLRVSPQFGGASPAIPAYLYAFLKSENVFAEARQKLFSNIKQFRQQLARPELFNFFDQYPVFYTQNQELCPFLLQHKVLISSFRYPTPADEPITRVILSSLHTTDDVDRVASIINHLEAESF
ncbi:aminotransferase class I/II-fold pyridoxal phosphate-dependent enzyme [Pontibacter vulgaris]|uniref:aminotransferase class I/II-fold pyridoxal phosphate-dependent enzyme n=1 Tax=Pontibacter vulgaris TaxID=2905679 RepID=UPI001FA77D74|nr:aminotransferase class I/II-fold pyridoxal phosphate-dependent enzyme [Pontibacter vulgaris]